MKLIKRLSLSFVFILIFSIFAGVLPQSIHANGFSAKSVVTKSFSSAHQPKDSEIVPGQVIVKYKQNLKSSSTFGVKTIGSKTQALYFSKDISVSDKIAELEKDPNVEYAEPDYRVHLADTSLPTSIPVQVSTSVPTPSPQAAPNVSTPKPLPIEDSVTVNVYFSNDINYMHSWGQTVTKTTYAKGLTSTTLASQVIVAVVDTGVFNHPDLDGALLLGKDFVNNDNDPQDDNGHGTNVAGIIAANGINFSGVAPGTKILPVKVLNKKGIGETSQVIAGINYAVTKGANIINLSLASSEDSQALHEAIQDAVRAGVLVVAAAGNEGNNYYYGDPGDISNDDTNGQPFNGRYAAYTDYPAAYPEVISVGAVEQLLNGNIVIADFSNVGKIDVVAPGVNIYSTYKDAAPNNYKYMSGTSQATPIVAGFAALLKANNRDLDVERLASIITESATPIVTSNIAYPNVPYSLNSFDIYGYGLINGQSAIQQPRLEINAGRTTFYNNIDLTINVSTKDYKGNSIPVNDSVLGRLYQISEDNVDSPYNLVSNSSINLGNGFGQYNIPNPNPSSNFYHYFVYIDDYLDKHNYIYSKTIDLVNRPATPIASQGNGTYTGPQVINLTSSGDSIYYSVDGGDYIQYRGSIILTRNAVLKTYAISNHVYSDFGTFSYVINSSSSTNSGGNTSGAGGGGGCGACGFVPPSLNGAATPTATATPAPTSKPSENLITKVDDGKSSLEVKPNKDFLIDLLNKSKEAVIIDAKSTQSLYTVSVDLDGNVMQKAKEKGTPIIIQSNDLQIHFAPDTLNLGSSTASVKFSATVADNQALPANTQAVSTIYDFNLSVDSVSTHTFNNPIEVHFSIDPAKVHTLNNLGVFYYNDSTQKWEYVGGTVSKDNTVTALLPHFSKYAVLENSKTFADIQSHWAKNEIEEMAAKQIINGMTEDSFKPEANITRAQFVSLLSRSLKLESPVDSIGFSDIPVNAWYKNDVYSAFNNQIVKGITEHTFAPEDKITREQLATLLVNAYLQKTGKQLSDIVTTQEVKYGDEGGISNWARANVRIATSLGLMSGSGNEKFNPKGLATRAEAAVVLERFLNKIK